MRKIDHLRLKSLRYWEENTSCHLTSGKFPPSLDSRLSLAFSYLFFEIALCPPKLSQDL